MRSTGKQTKRAVSLLLCLALLVSMLAFALTVRAEEVEEIADTGADTYYLWGEATNSPNFNGSTPSGTFTYDSSKGYYYCDVSGASGDYCFVISTNGTSASQAVSNQAVTTIADGKTYYVQAGNYHGFNCLHLWNPSGDALRFYFTSPSIGLTVVPQTASQPTQAPATQAPQPTQGGGANPTTAPQPTQGGGTSDKTYVYCENEAGWSSVYCYMWKNSNDSIKNAAWPGVKMTNIGGNTWRYEVTNSALDMIIFNIGSNQTQTGNMSFPGKDYSYNNKTSEWTIHDTSPLQVSSFATDLASPQYNGVGITLSAEAEGQGTVYYKFSVTGGNTTVLSDFSTRNQVLWTPQTAGTYTLTYDFKDTAGNTNQRTKSFVIEDGSTVVAPYIKTVTPSGGEVQNNTNVNLVVAAGGGNTGTNLLFYKYTVKNASGSVVNVPYYTRNTSYTFKPTSLGEYTVTINVQGSDNKTIERSYTFTSVGSVTPTEAFETQPPVGPTDAPPAPTQAPPQPTDAPPAPTQPAGDVVYGDADDDGDVTVLDVTYIQRFEANIALPGPLNQLNADVDADDEVSIIDATLIQRFLAGIIKKFPAES